MRVAVIDDHPLVWQGIKAVLQQEVDMELVGWASNGQEALELISQTEPDVTLVDLRLPGESGLDIIQKSKSGGGMGALLSSQPTQRLRMFAAQ